MATQLQLLGLPRLVVAGRMVAVSWPRRALQLLTYLYTSRGAVPRDTAAFTLWPDDDEEAARANLRRNLNGLRGVLPPDVAGWIVTDAGSIEFRHAAADTDVAAFEASLAQPLGLRDAVERYGGDFAQPLDDPWVLTERERLRARFHGALEELIGIAFSSRHFEDALRYARRIHADEPFREDIVRRIIAIRYAMGDRPGALTEYERFARALHIEMSVDPMPETAGLRDLVLRGEPLPFAPDAGGVKPVPPAATGAVKPLLPFTGRGTALDRLRTAWESAAGGAGSVVFVTGEAGIGKSRIVGEFLERSVGTSARILRGTTASPESRPYEALLRALAQAAPFVPALNLEPVWLAALAPLVPEIAQRCPELPAQAALPPEREETRLFEAMARFITALARGRAVAVVLEDLHWSGAGTFEAIRRLAARWRGHRILLVATYRTAERPAVESLARGLCDSGHAVAVALQRLSFDETVELLSSVEPALGEQAAELARRSEGHPLFLNELLRDPESRAVASGGISEVVGARLASCSAETQALAQVAAVCGAAFDLELVQRVGGWDDGALVDGIAELLGRQFVRSTAAHERGSYTFTHALVHAAVAATMPLAEQRRTHRIVARSLEAREAGGSLDAEIARHWQAAGEAQRAAEAFLRAARASSASVARDEAAALATAGLALTSEPATRRELLRCRINAGLRRVPAGELRPDTLALQDVCREMDEAARFDAALLAYRVEEAGGSVETRDAAAAVLRAFALGAAADGLRRANIAEADASCALMHGHLREAREFAQAARRSYASAAQPHDELRMAMLIANVQTRLGEFELARAELVAVEPRIAALDDTGLAMEYWKERSSVPHAQRNSAETLVAAERLEALARAAGDRLMEGTAVVMAATAYQHASALDRCLRELDRAESIYRSIGASLPLDTTRNNRASVLFQAGRIEESAVLLRDLYDECCRTGALESRYYAASNLGCALLAAGDVAGAVRFGEDALDLARQMGSERHAALAFGDLGEAEVAAGRTASGLARLREAAEINGRLGRRAVLAHDLARAAYLEPDPHRGAAHARAALAVVEADASDIALAPEILARCAHAFARADEASAAAYCTRRGREVLESRLAVMDAGGREHYRAIRWHRQLFDAAREDERIAEGTHARRSSRVG